MDSDSFDDFSLLNPSIEDTGGDAANKPTPSHETFTSTFTVPVPPQAQLHIELQQSQPLESSADPREEHSLMDEADSPVAAGTDETPESSQSAKEESSNLGSIFSGITSLSNEPLEPRGYREERTDYVCTDPPEEGVAQGTHHTDEDSSEEKEEGQKLAAENDGESSDKERSRSGVAVQRGEGGQVVLKFKTQAADGEAGEESSTDNDGRQAGDAPTEPLAREGSPKPKREEMSGQLSVSDRIRQLEQAGNNSTPAVPLAGAQRLIPPASPSQQKKQLKPPGLEDTSQTLSPNTAEKQQPLDERSKAEDDSRLLIAEAMEPCATPTEAPNSTGKKEVEEEEEDEFINMSRSDEGDQFSTPNGSPTFGQPAPSQPFSKSPHVAGQQQGFLHTQGQGSPVGTAPGSSPRPRMPTGTPGNACGQQRMMSPEDHQRSMSPRPIVDPERRHSMQGPESTGSAFRPVAMRPQQMWMSQHNIQGYGPPQYPPPSYQQQPYSSPPPQQGTPSPGMQQSFDQARSSPSGSYPDAHWQGEQQYPYQQSYQHQQQQQEFYHKEAWQQQQQQQQWRASQQQYQQHQQPGHASLSPEGVRGQSLGDPAGLHTPPRASGGGSPHFGGGPAQPKSTGGHPSSYTPQSSGDTDTSKGHSTPCTVRVSGVKSDVDLELLEFYFESPKKSGGGSVTNVDDHREEGYVLVTFEDPAVVERVLQRPHTVSKKTLTLSVHDEHAQQPEEQHTEDTEGFCCTVEVSGAGDTVDEEMMELYFESTKKSGGGKIKKIEVLEDRGVTLITFDDKKAAEAVVQKGEHVAYGTKLTVVPYKPPGPSAKIKVSGLTSKASEELLQLYFERTGDVKEVQLDSEKGEAVITFTDPEDAQAALQKSHKISGKPVTLSLVTSTPSPPVTKVNVSGLTSKASEELLELYFERTAVVQDVQLDAEKGKAVVTFANPEDVKAVLEKEHKISGKKVTVSLWTPSATSKDAKDTKPVPELSSSLKVEGLALNTSEETISYYFENKRRSGGGPVKDVQYSEGSGVAIITFEEADTAKRVLEKKHTIDGSSLKLRLYSQPSPQAQDDPRSEESKGLNTISVRGLTSTTSTDTLMNYFENKRRSGGGDVEDVRLDSKKEVFFVTFEDPQDAANVAERQHKLDGQTLEVSLYKPPEMCKDRILLRNLPEVKSADELVNFVEVKSGLTVNKVLFADEEGTAVAIFEDDIDRQKVQTALTKKQFKQRKLTVDSIPVSCTVLVNGLPVNQHVSDDILINYFENTKRSGGGDVFGVEMFINEQYALVTFDKPDVAARVAGKQHKIQSQPVNVNMYMECLGVGGGSEEPTAKIPQPFTISAEELHKISLLDLLPSLKELFLTSLSNQNACFDLNTPGSGSIVCSLTSETEGYREMAKSWAKGVQLLLQDFLPHVFSKELDVTEDDFAETQNILDEMIAGKPDVGFGYVANKNRLTIAYKGEEQKELVDNLVFKVGEVQQDLQRKKKETKAKMEFTRGQQRLLKKHKAIKDIPRMYPQLGIAYFEEDGYVELKGLLEETQAAKLAYLETSGVMTSLTRRWESPLHSKLLESAAAKKIVESLCLQEGPDDEVEFGPDSFHVYSFDAERAEVVQMTALKAVQRRVLKFDEASKEVLMTEEWQKQKESIMERNKDTMLMEEDSSSLTIVSVSDSRSVQKDYKALQDFLQENSVQEHPFPLPHAMHKLFKAYMQQKAYDIHLKVEDFEFDSHNDQIVATGNSMCLDAARQIYSSFRETLTERHKTYTQPSMKNFFVMSQWVAKREEIEHELKCLVLDPKDIPEGFMGWEDAAVRSPSPLQGYHAHDVFAEEFGSRSTFKESAALWEAAAMPSTAVEPKRRGNTRGKQKRDSAAAERPPRQPKPDLPARPRLYLSVMSDITKEEHHVLVNSSNTTLNMSNGQVSNALLKVGGPEIQQELATTYPQGITVGDVAVSSGGKLMCKKLFHCCLPEQKVQEDQEKMQQVVRDAVTKCMAEADKLAMGSIGFPSLGTGNLNYPAPLVCHTMFEAALDYGRQHPDTAISDVFFILHKKDENLTKVFREEEATYKQMLRDSKKVETEEEETEAAPVNPSAQGVKAHLFFQETQGKVRKLIIGVGPSAVNQAEKEILACYKDCIDKLTSDVQHLEQWDDLHIQTLIHSCKAAELDITFNFSLGHLELHGFRDNLGKIPLHQTIKEAEAVITEKYNSQLVAKQVQWSCIEIAEDGEHLLPYEMLNNYRIETSYQAGQDKVMIVDKGSAYIIVFSKMEEIPEDPGDDSPPVRVIRQNKINTWDVQPPREWSDMRGQDLDVVPLQAGSQEYAAQADIFLESLGKPNARIIKIERVQNLTLYKQYSAMKSKMESTMANDRPWERPNLWHGTREEAVQGIIKYGFNRSYSDLKKSAFGQGAYFAATAEYSSRNQYAVASQNGDRNMFLCRVLVGQFAVGTADMRIPPEITAGGERYNSTVNDAKKPDIFVTYSDVQAYPEYRILFNDQ